MSALEHFPSLAELTAWLRRSGLFAGFCRLCGVPLSWDESGPRSDDGWPMMPDYTRPACEKHSCLTPQHTGDTCRMGRASRPHPRGWSCTPRGGLAMVSGLAGLGALAWSMTNYLMPQRDYHCSDDQNADQWWQDGAGSNQSAEKRRQAVAKPQVDPTHWFPGSPPKKFLIWWWEVGFYLNGRLMDPSVDKAGTSYH